MLIPVLNTQGEKVNEIELNADIFEAPVNVSLMHQALVRQLANAAECARTFGHDYVGTEHLALSLLAETDGDAGRLVERLGVDAKSLRDTLAKRTRDF